MNKFYVYEYFNSDGVLYVGKGSKERMYDHFTDCFRSKTYWAKKLKKLILENNLPEIRVVQSGLTELEAFNLEIELISKYGRKDIGTGVLYNGCNGGTGSSGHTMSAEGRLKVSFSMKGRFVGNQFRKDIPHSEECKKRISESCKGRIESQETKDKKSKSLSWQIEKQITLAYELCKGKWWGKFVTITYSGETRRQSASSTHRLYNVTLLDVTVKRTITDFRQGSCPKEFLELVK